MAAKDFAEIDTGFPIFGLRFINNHTLLTCGGGGEGNNGIPNKVTAVRCSFTVSDKSRRLQKFREITLPSNEDSPMCVEFCPSSTDDESRYQIFVGCNQSTELIRSMNINNNLRKYHYTDDEHLQFSDAVQFDENLSVESIGEYPRIVHLSPDASVGGMMTSKIPSEIFIFNPNTLELRLRYNPPSPTEIKDFHFNPHNSGDILTYVTASFIETISTNSGNSISSSSTVDKRTAKTLGKYFFSKVRYVDETKVIITAALKNGKGAAVLEYNTETKKVTKEKVISKNIKGIVAIDVSKTSGLFAVAGNDFSVSLLKLSDFKVVKTYTKLHKFAVTCLSFSPDGKKLATGSASNTLNVLVIKQSSGGFFSFVYSLFRFIFFAVLVAVLASFVQRAHESGELDEYIELSKIYGGKALIHLQHYQEVGLELSQKYGKEYFELSQHYGKIGFDIAKEQSIRGFELLKEQISKHTASKEEVPIVEESSALPNWASENTERTSTLSSDIVGQITRNVHELTKGSGEKDTSSIINQATQLTISATATPTEVVQAPSVNSSPSAFSNEEAKTDLGESISLPSEEIEKSFIDDPSFSATEVSQQPPETESNFSVNVESSDTEVTQEATTEVSSEFKQDTETSQAALSTESTEIESVTSIDIVSEVKKEEASSEPIPSPPHYEDSILKEKTAVSTTDNENSADRAETATISNESIHDIAEKDQESKLAAEISSLGSESVELTDNSEGECNEFHEASDSAEEILTEATALQDQASTVEVETAKTFSMTNASEDYLSSTETNVVEKSEAPISSVDANTDYMHESYIPKEESFVESSESIEEVSNLENMHPDFVAERDHAAEIEKLVENIAYENSQSDEPSTQAQPEIHNYVSEIEQPQSTIIEPLQTSIHIQDNESMVSEIEQHENQPEEQSTVQIETSENSEVPVPQPESTPLPNNINSETTIDYVREEAHASEHISSEIESQIAELSNKPVHSKPASASQVEIPPQKESVTSLEASESASQKSVLDSPNVISTVEIETDFPEIPADHDEL